MKTSHETSQEADLFREELTQIINHRHPLFILAEQIDWDKAATIVEQWFDDSCGRPAKSSRLIAGLFLLKQLKNISDEDLPELWVENAYWQHFCGEKYFQHEFPIHPTSMTKWRKQMTAEDAQALLQLTIETALKTQTVKPSEFNRVNIDTTVQEKAVAYPTDSGLMVKAIIKLGKLAKANDLPIKQSYKFVAKKQLFKGANYRRAQQMKRAKKSDAKLKTYLGRLVRDIERKLEAHEPLKPAFQALLDKANRLLTQTRTSKNKLYSLHAPEVACIAKGKVTKRYEFGVKVSVVASQESNVILGAQALPGTPYDGHTLRPALDQVEAITGIRPKHTFADNGYKGHDEKLSEVHVARKKRTYATCYLKRLMKKRNAIEALFSHAKRDGQLGRNYLKGTHGDQLNALLSAVGHNLRLILIAIALFWRCFLSVLSAKNWMASLKSIARQISRNTSVSENLIFQV